MESLELTEKQQWLGQVFAGAIIFVVLVVSFFTNTGPVATAAELGLYLGVLIGVAGKVLVPFLRKIQEGKIEGFDLQFLWTAVTTYLYMIPLSMPIAKGLEVAGMFWQVTLVIGVFIGLGSNWATEELWKLIKMLINIYRQFTSSNSYSSTQH